MTKTDADLLRDSALGSSPIRVENEVLFSVE
jgi:hypothetical protein